MYYLYRACMLLVCILFSNVYASEQPGSDSHSTSNSSPTSNSSLASGSSRPVLQDNGIVRDVVKGSLMAFAEVAMPGQVLSYGMNRAIAGHPFKLVESYRGFGVNAVGQMPITALQVVAQTQGTRALRAYQHADPSDVQKLCISFVAGVLGAVVDTPCNATQLYQQDKQGAGRSMVYALRQLGAGAWRGYVPNAFLKEGPWAVGYQVLAPRGKQMAQDNFGQGVLPAVAGATAAGVVTAVVTHPGAVLRNVMQATLLDQTKPHLSLKQTVADIYAKKGWKGFFVGGVQRGLRVTIAVPLYYLYGELFEEWLRKE